jgi:hypothetical protein
VVLERPGLSWSKRGEGLNPAEAQVFTEYVRSVARGAAPDDQQLEALWKALRAALRSELKKRGLWDSPPAYLGIYGWESWEPAGARRGTTEESALEELLVECYSFIFIARLRSLEAHLKIKPNIDGLVFLNIRHFLHERQKAHDPLGSQVFEVLQSAVRTAVEEGDLEVIEGDPRIRNDTVLGFGPAAGPASSPREEISTLVARWNDELLPDLVTLRGRKQEEVVRRLRERLADLRLLGAGAVRFKDLVDPMKADVRARWAAILDVSLGEVSREIRDEGGGETVRLAPPDNQYEEQQIFYKLIACVLSSVERLEVNDRTRTYLATLWQFVRIQASEGVEASPGAIEATLAAMGTAGEERPSLRHLAEQLRIPRDRLPGLYQLLGDQLQRCRAAISGKAAVRSRQGKSRFAGGGPRTGGH